MPESLEFKSVERAIKEKDIVLIVLSKSEYSEKILGIARIAAGRGGGLCYVSVNKPASSLLKVFGAEGIDTGKIKFIDCISRAAFSGDMKNCDSGNIIFLSSPRNLTELSINIAEVVAKGIKSVFVDALSTFLIYEDGMVVIRFAHTLITKLREAGGHGALVILQNDISGALLDDLGMFVDCVVEA